MARMNALAARSATLPDAETPGGTYYSSPVTQEGATLSAREEGSETVPNQNPNAVAICGLYCGACFNWVNCHDKDDRLIEPRDPAHQACEGCRSDNLPPQCAACEVRHCAQGLGFTTCAECSAMPCDKVQGKADYPRPHINGIVAELKKIREIGEQGWGDAQRERWTCPKCGAHTSWYQETCGECGAAVSGFDRRQWKG